MLRLSENKRKWIFVLSSVSNFARVKNLFKIFWRTLSPAWGKPRFSQIRVQRYYFFLKCANFLFLFFLLARRAWGGKKPKKHPSRRIVTLSGPLAVAVSLCNCKQAFIAPTAITITYQGRPIQRRAKTPARAQRRPKKPIFILDWYKRKI